MANTKRKTSSLLKSSSKPHIPVREKPVKVKRVPTVTYPKTSNPVKAIRYKCLDCCGDSPKEVKECAITDCPCWDFRLGNNPNRKKRELTDEQREALKERMNKAREVRMKNIGEKKKDKKEEVAEKPKFNFKRKQKESE